MVNMITNIYEGCGRFMSLTYATLLLQFLFLACNVGDEGGFAPNILSNMEGENEIYGYLHYIIAITP